MLMNKFQCIVIHYLSIIFLFVKLKSIGHTIDYSYTLYSITLSILKCYICSHKKGNLDTRPVLSYKTRSVYQKYIVGLFMGLYQKDWYYSCSNTLWTVSRPWLPGSDTEVGVGNEGDISSRHRHDSSGKGGREKWDFHFRKEV